MSRQVLPFMGSTQGSSGPVTFTLIQHATNFACTTSACSVTTASTTAGNLLILWSETQYSGTGVASVGALTSVTDNGTGETWTHCPQSQINDSQNSNGTIHGLDCFYILSAAGGATSVTATWTLTGLTTPTFKTDVELLEYHPSSTPIFYDTGNAFLNSGTCSSCSGPAGLLSGNSDVISQALFNPNVQTINSISAPYSNPFDTDAAGNALFAGFAGAINSASYAQPTWTLSAASNNPTYYSSVAFSGNSSPAPTGSILIDFSACTNGSAPTTTCVGNSTFSGWALTQTGLNGADPGMTVCTSVMNTLLPATTTINGVAKTGNSSLDLCGVTAASGTNIGYYEIDLGISNLQAMYNPLTVGFSFRSSCPGTPSGITGDCGALGVRLANGNVAGFYAVAHASPLGDGHWALESSNGGGAQEGSTPFAYAPNTNYRINIQMAGLSGTVDKMTVCTDGPGGTVLGTITATSAATSNGISAIQIGIAGEEPTTAGYNYYFRNIVVGGIYSTTSCF